MSERPNATRVYVLPLARNVGHGVAGFALQPTNFAGRVFVGDYFYFRTVEVQGRVVCFALAKYVTELRRY